MYNDHTIFHKIYSKVRASHLFIEPRPAGHGIRAYPEHASKVISTICKALGLKVVRIFCRVLLTWTNPQFGDALGTVTTSASLHHYICITTSASLHLHHCITTTSVTWSMYALSIFRICGWWWKKVRRTLKLSSRPSFVLYGLKRISNNSPMKWYGMWLICDLDIGRRISNGPVVKR